MTDDPPFAMDRLLEHRAWVSRLARRLCRDEHAADDSVQAVFTLALQRPPRHEGNLRAWLATLLRTTLGTTRRTQRRRDARERAHGDALACQHIEDTVDVVARAEAHRHLVDRVLDLPEPQRSFVLWHYFEDVRVETLARRAGTSADAVRAHLRRARERLRRELEPEQRRGLLLLAAAGTPAAASAALSTGILMAIAWKAAAAAGVALAALLLWAPWSTAPAPQAFADAAATASVVASGPAAAAAPDAAPATAAAERVAATLPASDEVTLRGELVGLVADVPWRARLRIEARGRVDGERQEHEHDLVPDTAGSFEFVLPPWTRRADNFELRIRPTDDDNYDAERAEFGARVLTDAEVLPFPVTIVARCAGRVLDPRNQPVPAARICAYRVRDGLPIGDVLASTNAGADGRYTLRMPAAGDFVLLAVPMHEASLSGNRMILRGGAILDDNRRRTDLLPIGVLAGARLGELRQVATHHLPDASAIAIVITTPVGLHPAAVVVRATPLDVRERVRVHEQLHLAVWDLTRCAVEPAAGEMTGPDATLAAPAGTRWNLRPILRDSHVLQLCEQNVVTATAPAPVTLAVAGTLRTLQVVAGGQPVPEVMVQSDTRSGRTLLRTDGAGCCRVLLGETPHACTIEFPEFAPQVATLGPGSSAPEPIVVTLTTPRPTAWLELELTGEHRVRHVHVTLRAVGEDKARAATAFRNDDDALPFRFRLPVGVYDVALAAPDRGERRDTFLVDSSRQLTLPEEGVRVEWAMVHGGRCRVQVVDGAGPRSDWTGELRLGDTVVGHLEPQGLEALSRNLKAGDYTAAVTLASGAQRTSPVRITSLEETEVRIDLR